MSLTPLPHDATATVTTAVTTAAISTAAPTHLHPPTCTRPPAPATAAPATAAPTHLREPDQYPQRKDVADAKRHSQGDAQHDTLAGKRVRVPGRVSTPPHPPTPVTRHDTVTTHSQAHSGGGECTVATTTATRTHTAPSPRPPVPQTHDKSPAPTADITRLNSEDVKEPWRCNADPPPCSFTATPPLRAPPASPRAAVLPLGVAPAPACCDAGVVPPPPCDLRWAPPAVTSGCCSMRTSWLATRKAGRATCCSPGTRQQRSNTLTRSTLKKNAPPAPHVCPWRSGLHVWLRWGLFGWLLPTPCPLLCVYTYTHRLTPPHSSSYIPHPPLLLLTHPPPPSSYIPHPPLPLLLNPPPPPPPTRPAPADCATGWASPGACRLHRPLLPCCPRSAAGSRQV